MKRINKYKTIARTVIESHCLLFFVLFVLVFISSCEDFVDIEPPITEVVSETVYINDETAIAAMRGIYIEMISGGFASGDLFSVTNLVGLSSDELLDFQGANDRVELNRNNLSTTNGNISRLWNEAYGNIYNANSVLEGVSNSSGLTNGLKMQLEGEAKFIRAFFHFYLANLFGDVPIVTSTDFRTNNEIPRSAVQDVFQQVILDLQAAQNVLADGYSFSDDERVQPNQFAATALLARTHLYIGDWANAELQATNIIDNTELYSLEDELNNVFLANSTETIWQLKPVVPGQNTKEASGFINEISPNAQVLTPEMVSAFEEGDGRRLSWVDSIIFEGLTYYHPFKYKIDDLGVPLTEYSMVLRLAEQYLIRSEARAQMNDIVGAQADLNIIRNRAGLPNTTANDRPSLLLAIEQERRIELFTEWGHRWLDLKRTGRVNDVLSPLLMKDWELTDRLYPIPQSDRLINENLTQNDGY